MTESAKTINIVAAALGGEGGGVLTDWLIEVANAEGYLAQTTSLAGVAQRTGATIYYIELFPRAMMNDTLPVMSLFPAQGDIDVAIASEIAEAGRMVQRGFVTPDRTTLIASTHRVFGITEKIQLGDGAVDAAQLESVASRYAKRFLRFNMLSIAERNGTVISAALLGALAGSGALPFRKESFETVIEQSGVAVKANLAAFRECFDRAANGAEKPAVAQPERIPVQMMEPEAAVDQAVVEANDTAEAEGFELPAGTTRAGRALLTRLRNEFAAPTHFVMYHALRKLVDYQDSAYANQYLDTVARVAALDKTPEQTLTTEFARYLGLWMCFEDIPRVAQLKVRGARLDKVRSEVRAEPGQIISIVEFFSPRMEEICGMLPASWAQRLLGSARAKRVFAWFSGGRQLRTNSVAVYTVLCALAGMRHLRRRSWNYRDEFSLLNRWVAQVERVAAQDAAAAVELTECGRLIKGYGDTRHRTKMQMQEILTRCEESLTPPQAEGLRSWRVAAFKDDEGTAFRAALNAA